MQQIMDISREDEEYLFLLIKLATKKQKNPTMRAMAMIQAVSRTFDVSPEAAKYRLQELGHIDNNIGNVGFLNAGIVFPNA